MEPLRQYLGKQFELASEAWSFVERGKAAAAMEKGLPYNQNYRILSVAEGWGNDIFYAQLRLLFNGHLWAILRPMFCTVSRRASAFMSLSRMGCAFMKLLVDPHRKCPYQTFRILRDPLFAKTIGNLPRCLLGEWTKALMAQDPSLEGPEVLEVMRAVASVVRVDISHIEARHASIRRMLTVKSVQTHPFSFEELSAQWVLQQHRTSEQFLDNLCQRPGCALGGRASSMHRTRPTLRKKEKAPSAKQRRRAGFGGPWRAWVRLRCAGRRRAEIDPSAQAAAYNAAKEQGFAEYMRAVRLGRAATAKG